MKKLFTLPLLLVGHFTFAQLDSLLLANWSLDGDANDKTKNAYHGSFVGNVTPTENRFGKAGCAVYIPKEAHFQYYNGAANNFQFYGKDASFSFWVKLSDVARKDSAFLFRHNYQHPNVSMSNVTLVLKSDSSLCLGHHFSYTVFDLECNKITTSALVPSQWYHIVLTYKHLGRNTTFYLNGSKISEISHYYGGEAYNAILKFGELLDASFDDIRYYSRVLSANDVTQLYTLPSSCGTITEISMSEEVTSAKHLVGAVNLIGQEIDATNYTGAAILLYSDGSRQKVIK